MSLPTIPSINPTKISAKAEVSTSDAFGFHLHFYIAPPFEGSWTLVLGSWNWDAATGTFAPKDTEKTPEAEKAQHEVRYDDVRPYINKTLEDGSANPQFVPKFAEIFAGVLQLFPPAMLLKKAEASLAAAFSLSDTDKTKVEKVTAAQDTLDSLRKSLGA